MSKLAKKFRVSSGQDTPPDRHAFYSLLLAYAVAISPHVARLPYWYAVLAFLVFSWCYKIVTGNGHQPGRFIRIIILFAVVFILFRSYGTLLGRDPGVAMLTGLTLLKFLELKTQRDYMLVVFLCMFIVLTAFLYSQSIWIGIYLFIVLVVLLSVLMYLNHRSRLSIASMFKRSLKLVVTGLPVAVLLFVLFPRLQSGIFKLPGDSHSGLSGMSDTMKPGSINELNLSNKVAFRVEFTGKIPEPEQRYWRGLVLDRYENGTWSESKVTRSESRVRYRFEDTVEYSVLLEPSNKKWVFALDMPVEKPGHIQWGDGIILRSPSRLSQRQEIRLRSALKYSISDISDAEYMRNIDTDSVSGNRLMKLARELYSLAGNNDRLYLNAVYNYFRENNFVYSLQPPVLGENPVESFMFATRSGYCEHYASAFTTMMRLAAIPARVVIGYQGGEWNDQGEYMIVRQSDAHAWSEVWLEEGGWTRIDPTSAVAPERIEFGISAIRQLLEQGETLGQIDTAKLRSLFQPSFIGRTARNIRLMWDDVNTRWYKWIIGYGTKNQQSLLRLLGFKSGSLYNLVVTLVILVSLVLSVQAWFLYRREKIVDPVRGHYRRFCKKLERIGFPRDPSEGPLNYAKRIIKARPDLEKQVSQVTGLYIGILYGGKDERDQVRRLKTSVTKFWPKPARS